MQHCQVSNPNMASCMPISTPSVPTGDYGVYTKADRRDIK